MQCYELTALIHPDCSDQVPDMMKRISDQVAEDDGQVHLMEDWGRRLLAYSVNRVHKAHYIWFNFSASPQLIEKLNKNYTFNDAVIRHLLAKQKTPTTQATEMIGKDDMKLDLGRKMPRISRDDLENISFYHIDILKYFVMENGRIIPCRMTGVSPKTQRKISHSVKLARLLALFPYCDHHK